MKKLFFLFLVGFLAGVGYCKDVSVVMVGNKVVMESDVRAKMRDENRNYDEALRELVSEKLLLTQAEKEGITATDAEMAAEINRIAKRFPDEKVFMQQMEKEGIPYELFKSGIEGKLKVRKLVRQNVVEKITISAPEIIQKMQELEKSGGYSYNFRTKWFDSETAARNFIRRFESAKESEMDDAGWLNAEEVLPEIMDSIGKIAKDELGGPVKIGNRYLVLFLKDTRENKLDVQALYVRARNSLYNAKFSVMLDKYIRELQSRTPMLYSD